MTDPALESEAASLRDLFGAGAVDAAQARAEDALERHEVDKAMFWLSVRTLLEGIPPRPYMRIA